MYSQQVFVIWTLFGLISVFLLVAFLKLEITVCFLWLSLPVNSGSMKTIYYSKLYSLTHTLLLNVSSALKETHFYILFVVTATGVVLYGCILETRNYRMLSLGFTVSSFRVTEESLLFLTHNHFINVFSALKGIRD